MTPRSGLSAAAHAIETESVRAVSERGSSFPTTRQSLLGELGQAEASAPSPRWQEFFDLYGPVVYRCARHAHLSDASAEDVVANVLRNFVAAVRGGFKVDAALGRFRSYLRTIVNHEILAQRRRDRHARHTAPLDDEPGIESADAPPDSNWIELERQERFRACLDRLRATVQPRDILAFERYAILGESAERVARESGISVSRLYSLKYEMVGRLRELAARMDAELGEVE